MATSLIDQPRAGDCARSAYKLKLTSSQEPGKQISMMDIAEVARASGLPASTLRFYEEKGLIQSSGRNGLRRLFKPSVIERLALISLGRSAGFSLDEIGEMFTPAGPDIDRGLLLAKADELDQKIQELSSMRDGLRHAAACKAPSHLECPSFQRLLRIARKKRPARLSAPSRQPY